VGVRTVTDMVLHFGTGEMQLGVWGFILHTLLSVWSYNYLYY